ncbi:MAG: hypothetical protein DWQ34_13080 [Planctomycetota bacterium]|nr:MAG: hypothetical protein DWQ34_13080 [Planctomycetota bacterium]REJ94024.1 MAG: hypothetical protein DWQ29_03315 [Planctomycetota bacterium]REK26898.1 MAG: hypothetical protein DWQ41_08630 [Planctomycetota bacterium]REK35386.1 MAG: hypothetical protein DWQ45_11750 [Planctomycetota bacterium]
MWPAYFRENRPTPTAVQAQMIKLHSAGEHEHVISALQSAVINGQSQPWMYEVLALSMELAGRPAEQIERVVHSLSDFGGADFQSMMYSAAYLARLDRRAAALRLYQQAAKIAPEQPEPYILGLPHARHLRDADGVEWAACGILRYGWTRDYAALQRDAENAALEAEQGLRRSGHAERADSLAAAVAQARQRDLLIRLEWSGRGDLDLSVEEPVGTICSFENRDTAGGGVLTHDGYGPQAENCYDEYVCAYGAKGAYRIRIKHAWGTIVGDRARLTVTRHVGTDREESLQKTIVLDRPEQVVQVNLPDGRRTKLKTVATFDLNARFDAAEFVRHQAPERTGRDGVRQAALEEFERSRDERVRRAGAVGFQPVIAVIPEGIQLTTGAVVSGDRRYVRISAFPVFSNITDVVQFSFVGGAGGAAGGGGGANAP